jgi:hypothetical protein
MHSAPRESNRQAVLTEKTRGTLALPIWLLANVCWFQYKLTVFRPRFAQSTAYFRQFSLEKVASCDRATQPAATCRTMPAGVSALLAALLSALALVARIESTSRGAVGSDAAGAHADRHRSAVVPGKNPPPPPPPARGAALALKVSIATLGWWNLQKGPF